MGFSFRFLVVSCMLMLGASEHGQLKIFASAYANEAKSKPENYDFLKHDWPHDVSSLKPDGKNIYGKLDNGLRYILRKNSKPEKEAVLHFYIRAGRRNEDDDKAGVGHFLEHMAFNGSQNVPEGEMVKSLQRLGMKFGADTNASVGFRNTRYKLQLPDVSDELIDYSLFLMRETADKLLIAPDAVGREYGVIKAELARKNTAIYKERYKKIKAFYPNALLSKKNRYVSPEDVDAVTVGDLRTFYQQHYRPERSMIVMVGDFDTSKIEAKIKSVFSDWKNDTKAPDDPGFGTAENLGLKAIVHDDDGLLTNVEMVSLSESSRGVDTLEQRKANVLRSFGASIINQRISKLALESAEGATSGKIKFSSNDLTDYVSGSFRPQEGDDWRGSIEAMVNQLKMATEFGFTQTELDNEVVKLERKLKAAKKKNNGRSSLSYVNSFIASIEAGNVWMSPKAIFKGFKEHIKEVTPKDVQAAVTDAMVGFEPVIWLSGPEVQNVSAKQVVSVYNNAKAIKVKPLELVENKSFAYQDFGPVGKVVSRKVIDDLGLVQIVFDNNVRLNLKKTDIKGKKRYMSVRVGEGWNAFPKDVYGLAEFASFLYLGGLKEHKYSELAELFPTKKLNRKMSVGKDRLIFSGSVGKKDTSDQLKLWAAQVSAPGYRNEWYELYAKGLKKSFPQIENSPKRIAKRDLNGIWTSGDRRYVFPGIDVMLAHSIDDVRKVVDPILSKGAIEIGVVGNFKEKKIIAEVAKTFGALPTRNLEHRALSDAFDVTFPKSDRVTLTHTGESDQGQIYLAWPLLKQYSIERLRYYQTIRHILRLRLYDVIREDNGIAYSLQAALRFSAKTQKPNSIYVSASVNAKHHARFEELVKEIVSDLRKGSITQDELNRAIKPVLEDLEKNQNTNRYWSRLVGLAQSKPRVIELYRTHRELLESMTPEVLNRAVRELFSPDLLHTVAIVPESTKKVKSVSYKN